MVSSLGPSPGFGSKGLTSFLIGVLKIKPNKSVTKVTKRAVLNFL